MRLTNLSRYLNIYINLLSSKYFKITKIKYNTNNSNPSNPRHYLTSIYGLYLYC